MSFPFFCINTASLIEQFRRITQDTYGLSAKSKLPLPPTSGKWDPTDPNTLLRVLCYRNDEMASSFLKKTYDLPSKLIRVPEMKLTYDSMLDSPEKVFRGPEMKLSYDSMVG